MSLALNKFKRGDFVVCLTDEFQHGPGNSGNDFTKGKVYKVSFNDKDGFVCVYKDDTGIPNGIKRKYFRLATSAEQILYTTKE